MVPRLAAVALCLAATPLAAQSLTPEELRAMVDERVSQQNPFEELLNDPDPARSLAAMEIMLESGDKDLVRMALEFGLLSTNPSVRRIAVESFLNSKPVLTLRFDGSEYEGNNWRNMMSSGNATHTPDGIGYWRLAVGDYDEAKKCHKHAEDDACFITVNADGVIWQLGRSAGRLEIGETGSLVGSSQITNLSAPIPTSIRLLD